MECFYILDITFKLHGVCHVLILSKRVILVAHIFIESLVYFKIENGDPVLDIKCILCTEMILHALQCKLKLDNDILYKSIPKSYEIFKNIIFCDPY